MRKEFDHNQHSVYLLYYHLIMVVKYRKKVIDDNISNRLCEIFTNIGNNYGITVLEWNHDIDYVQVMFKGIPGLNMSKFINAYKSARNLSLEYDVISIEDLDLQELSKHNHYGKSIYDNSYGKFTTLLNYYMEKNNKKLIKVDKFFPSSKKCSCCGNIKKELSKNVINHQNLQ